MLPTKVRSFLNSVQENDSFLFRYFVRKGWSTWSLLLCLAIIVGTPLSSIKLLPTGPAHIQPNLKISVLDWIAAKRHSSKAISIGEGMAQGDLLHTWKMAISANPGNTQYQRNYLKALIVNDRHRNHWQDALDKTKTLLTLTRTNVIDLELACGVFEHYQLDDRLLETLEHHQGARTSQIEKSHLIALFSQGRVNDFQTQLSLSSPETREDPIFKLHQTALLDSCDTEGTSQQAYKSLEEALNEEETTEVALRLQLYVSHKNEKVDEFERSFTLLTHRFEDKTVDHLLYWDLLKRSNRVKDAKAAAEAFTRMPKSAAEVIGIADGFTKLGLKQLGCRFLEHYIDEFGTGDNGRHAQSKILIEEEDWGKLERLALAIRANDSVAPAFIAYSYFLEGLALHRTDRTDDGRKAFGQISQHSMTNSDLALYVGSQLWELRYPEFAYAALSPERQKYRNSTTFWELMLDINLPLENSSQMLIAAENLVRLVPDSMTYGSSYAMLVLTQPHRGEEALKLTTEMLTLFPENSTAQLNHGYALIKNDRYSDAVSILANLGSGQSLGEKDLNRFHLAWMEIYFKQNDFKNSWRRAQQIVPENLLPEYRAQFQSIWGALESEDPTQFQPNLSLLQQ